MVFLPLRRLDSAFAETTNARRESATGGAAAGKERNQARLTAQSKTRELKGMDRQDHILWLSREILPHEADLRRWLTAYTRGIAGLDVDDVVQEAYARLWAADPSRINEPRAYFFTTARNLVSETLRRSNIVPIEAMADIDTLNIVSPETDAERRLSGREDLRRLLTVLTRLPKRCRQTFELRKFEGLSQRQIAGRMGIAESTVEKHLAKALRLVMDGMKEGGAGEARTIRRDDEPQRNIR